MFRTARASYQIADYLCCLASCPRHTQDLIDATRKSFAAGLGEWDLQTVEWGHPDFKQQLLKVWHAPFSRDLFYFLSLAGEILSLPMAEDFS